MAGSCRGGISSPLSHPLSARNDLLAHERRARAEAEGESKAQKKLLVKEVKALRIQLSQMTTERDAYKQQARSLQLR